MTIELISKENHDKLTKFYNERTNLSLQNKGYEGINKDTLTEEDKKAIQEIEEILNNSIVGFSRFQNFRESKKYKEPEIRLQYNYSADQHGTYFIGVGYILISELLNGFKK